MKDVDERRITRTIFLFSLAIHCLALTAPGFNFSFNRQDQKVREVEVVIDIKKPPLLPKIDTLAEEKKLKEIEQKKDTPEPKQQEELLCPDDQIVWEEDILLPAKADVQDRIEEKIEILNPDDEALLRYQDMVKQKIESCRKYPRWAKKQSLEGISRIMFILLSNGVAQDIRIIQSSGFNILDKEAISTVERASPFKPIPGKFHCSSLTIEVAIAFQLQ